MLSHHCLFSFRRALSSHCVCGMFALASVMRVISPSYLKSVLTA